MTQGRCNVVVKIIMNRYSWHVNTYILWVIFDRNVFAYIQATLYNVYKSDIKQFGLPTRTHARTDAWTNTHMCIYIYIYIYIYVCVCVCVCMVSFHETSI